MIMLMSFGVLGGAAAAAKPGASPNIVFILADDLGIDWLSCYGAEHATPNLDRLAARGVRFETAWTSPICTPSRVCLLTGLYNGRTGWTEHYDVPRWGGQGLPPARFATWPQVLREHGYATAIVGKWQVNDLRSPPDILRRHGFDFHCMWPGVEAGNPASEPRYWSPYLQIDGDRRTHEGAYGPDLCQAYALDFIRRHKDGPFLLYYPMIAVHAPLEPTPLNKADPPKSEAGLHADAVTYLDRQVGELMAELDKLGLGDRTVVIFAGDNGSAAPGSIHGRRVPAGKGRTTDRGVHVPLIVCAPTGAPGGWVASELADTSDVFPTVLELAGIARAGYPVDGQSWAPLLRRAPDYTPRSWIYAQRHQARTVRNQRYKLNSSGELYDLRADPDEKKPLRVKGDAAAEAAHAGLSAVLARLPADALAPPFPEYTPARLRQSAAAGELSPVAGGSRGAAPTATSNAKKGQP